MLYGNDAERKKQQAMNNTNNIPQEIQDKANRMIAAGSKLSFDAVCAILMKADRSSAKKLNSAKSNAKWEQRELVNNTQAAGDPSAWLAAKNRENAIKNLPSSLR